MAIYPQQIVRFTSCLVLGWGFWGRLIEWRYFLLSYIQDTTRLVSGDSPSMLFLGREASAPLDLVIELPPDQLIPLVRDRFQRERL